MPLYLGTQQIGDVYIGLASGNVPATAITVTENGTYTPALGSYYSSVSVEVPEGPDIINEDIIITPSETATAIEASEGYTGIGTVTVNAVSSTYIGSQVATKAATTYTPSTINQTINANTYLTGVQTIVGDADLIASNIKSGVNIFGVAGSYSGTNRAATATPTESAQTITPGTGYTGLSSVYIKPIPSAYKNTSDADIMASDILSGKIGYNSSGQVVGTMTNNGTISGTITTQNGNITIPAGYTSGGTITATLTASTITSSAITGQAYLEATNDYGWSTSITIPAGYYNATTITATYSSFFPAPSTSATSDKILLGYSAYDKDGKIVTGSMANNNYSATLDQTTTAVTIPEGYHDGTGTVSHTVVDIPNPTITVSNAGLITASGSWTRGFTTDNSYSNTKQLTTKAATTFTPGTTNQTIASGTYLTGIQTIVGDGNLVASNIKNGVTIFDVEGTYVDGIHPSGTLSISSNGSYSVYNYATATVNIPIGSIINNQDITITPSETTTAVSASSDYTGLGTVTVNGISTTYVGSKVTRKVATTFTPGTSNQTIATDTYLTGTQTILGDADLVAGNIKSGVNIFGVAGTYTGTNRAVTATPSETAQTITPGTGYTGLSSVYINPISSTYIGSEVATKATTTYTPGTTNQTISADTYLTGVQTILGDADLVAGNIKSGVNIFGVTGSYAGTNQAITATPTESAQTISPDEGYTGLSSVYIKPISSTYIGSEVATKAATTYTPGTTNQTISGSTYLTGTQTIIGDADLIAGNIKSGVNIFGVTGTYAGTNRADTATPSESAQTITPGTGYTGLSSVYIKPISSTYVGSNVATKAATTYTPGTTNQTIAASTYLTGVQTIVGDADLIAGNIKSGVNIFGVAGTYAGTNRADTATPSESAQTITPGTGYTGLSSVYIKPISSTYVGSQVPTRTSSNLIASGATVYAHPGYYSTTASKAISNGSASTPATTITANPSINVSASGLVSVTASASKQFAPTVSAGYISSGTTGTVTVKGSSTLQLTTASTTAITPTITTQTLAVSGAYMTGNIMINPIPSNYITTTDANATAADINDGKTAYVNGVKITGSQVIHRYYTGTAVPASSLGDDGDIYLQVSGA